MKVVIRSALVAGVVVGIAAVILRLFWYTPTYDTDNPDHQRLSQAFAELGAQIEQVPLSERTIGLSHVNEGSWKRACLFGGYTDPLREMQTFGATIDAKDETRLTEARSRGLRAAQVEESEVMVAYVDLNNHAHFIHFERGMGPIGQHFQRCVSKPETSIIIPPG